MIVIICHFINSRAKNLGCISNSLHMTDLCPETAHFLALVLRCRDVKRSRGPKHKVTGQQETGLLIK